jgi:hypothetical protein
MILLIINIFLFTRVYSELEQAFPHYEYFLFYDTDIIIKLNTVKQCNVFSLFIFFFDCQDDLYNYHFVHCLKPCSVYNCHFINLPIKNHFEICSYKNQTRYSVVLKIRACYSK